MTEYDKMTKSIIIVGTEFMEEITLEAVLAQMREETERLVQQYQNTDR